VRDFEDRIRRELTAVATLARPETIRPLRAPNPRGRPLARRWPAAIAAMAAVAGIAAGVTVAGRQTAPGPTSAAGHPDIYVTLTARFLRPGAEAQSDRPVPVGSSIVLSATVRDASTGAALTSLQVWPRRPEHPRGPVIISSLAVQAQITGAADDRTFVVQDWSRLFLLRVAGSGRSARLVRLHLAIPGVTPSSVALSPGGTELAADVTHCPPGGCVEGIEIISLSSGASRIWLGPSVAGAPLRPSWTDAGKAVMFEWASGRFARNGYRLLQAAAKPGSLLSRSVPMLYPRAGRALPPTVVLTPDGHSLLVVTRQMRPATRHRGVIEFRITDVSPRTGRVIRVLETAGQVYVGNPDAANAQCNILGLAPVGLHAVVQCPGLGRLDGSMFTPLPGGPVLSAAW
jgi:hypothetical protein